MAVLETLNCLHCLEEFVQKKVNQRYCTERCQQHAYNRRRMLVIDRLAKAAAGYTERMGERKYG